MSIQLLSLVLSIFSKNNINHIYFVVRKKFSTAFSYIPYVLSEEKGNLLEKSYFISQPMIWDILGNGFKMGILAEDFVYLCTCNLIFVMLSPFPMSRMLFVLFLKKGVNSIRNTCGK
jgi:hypothetical protein